MSRLKWMVALAGAAAVATATVAPVALADHGAPATPTKPASATVQDGARQARPQSRPDPCKYEVTQKIKYVNRHTKAKVVNLKITTCKDKQQKVGLYISRDGRHDWKLVDVAYTDRRGEHTFIRPKSEHGAYVVRGQSTHRVAPVVKKDDKPAPRVKPVDKTPPPMTCKADEKLVTDPKTNKQTCTPPPPAGPPTCAPGQTPVVNTATTTPSCVIKPQGPPPAAS
jgi:hypothetical protein